MPMAPPAATPLAPEHMRRIMAAALRAPSQDNCQPWSFAWRAGDLLVFHDEARATSPTNVGGHFSYLSLGCLLESIQLAAAADGLAATWRMLFPATGATAEQPWAIVSFSPASAPSEAARSVAAGLERRWTDRRAYRGGDLADPVFVDVARDADSSGDCSLYLRDPHDPKLLSYLERAEGYVWSHSSTHQALMRWIRFGSGATDGMPWQCLGGTFLESRVLECCRSYAVQRMLNPVFAPTLRRRLRRQIASSAALGCVTVRAVGAAPLLEAGRVALRTWVRLNVRGFAYQPLAVAAIGVYNAWVGSLPADTRPVFRDIFVTGRSTLGAAFGFPETELPVWLFRTGWSAPCPHDGSTRTPRRALHQVLRDPAEASGDGRTAPA
ncbi:MAG: hypothetical protein LC797_00570 [Chloroflexi bacterium]|nr:hypothetical protein [Chloroflexota bacterium]